MCFLYCLLHFYFNWLLKICPKKVKKINNLSTIIIVLLSLHYLLIISLYMISDLFNLKGKFITNFMRQKKNCFLLILIFSIVYVLCSAILLKIYDITKLQILNFLFSFLIIFEVCIKIAQSQRFISWIGEQLDKTFRLLIMFIIGLNCTYFFTRITLQVIRTY